MKKLRKILTIGVMVLSVIAMSGLVVAPAKAAASAGDLIKMSGNASVYYLGSDGKRYVFPNSTTYFSWYNDFSGVVTIPAAELQSYPLGGNVTMRPGTKLVKITTDPSVYAVEPNGTLRKIQSEAQASALYGTNWNKRVVDVPDAFFVNYVIGAPLANGAVPAGSLVKNASGADVYYFDGTNYRKVATEAAFTANRFQFANVITAPTTVTAGGSAVNGAETALVNVAQNGGSGPVVTGSGLMVSLSSNTPAAISVPQNGARVPMAKVNLTAANDGAVSVNSITVKRTGLTAYSDVDKVWAEKDGVTVASKKSMNSNDEAILVFSPALTVPAGQTVSIDLIASLSGTGGNMALSIASASAVSATSAAVTGSFPVTGNLMSLTSYSVTNLAITDPVTSQSTVKVGDEKVELGHFTLGFNGTARDVTVNSITLKNNGVEDLSKTTLNLYLENAGNKVSDHYTIDGRFVTFYFPAGGFDLLKDDGSKIFYLKGDVIAKENTGDLSFNFFLNKSTDLVAYEKSTGFGTNVYNATSGSTLADNVEISNIKIDAGSISVSKKSTSPSDTTIVKGSDNVMLLANFRADEAINADGLRVTYASTNNTSAQFENVRVYVNGLLVDSFDPAVAGGTTVALDSSITLNKGDNEIKIAAKAKTNATAGSLIKFTLAGADIFTSMNPEYVVSGNAVSGTISGTATGATFTVQGASMTTVRSDGYAANKVIVQGSTDVSLAKFTVKALNDEVRINSISLGANSGSGTATLASSISDMKLYVDGAQVGNTVDFGTSGSNFSSLNITIAKDATKIIELKGSFDSAAVVDSTFKTQMTINAQDSRGTAIPVSAGVNRADSQQFQVKGQGTLTVEAGGDTPVAGLLASKNADQEVAQFKFTAVNDSANLTEINVSNVSGAGADPRIAAIKLYDGATLLDQFVPVSGAGKFTLNNNVIIAANTSKTLSVKVSLNNIENDATATNADVQIRLTTVKAKSSAGAEYTSGSTNVNANAFRIRKTVPTIAFQALPDTLLNAGDKVIAKFTVTADANADVTVGRFALTVTESANADVTAVASPLKVNGADKTATANYSGGKMTVTLGSPEIVAAGTTKTFEVIANVAVSGAGAESVSSKIAEDGSYDANATLGSLTGDFAWSDGASIESYTWANGHNVSGLETPSWTLSKN